MAAGSVINFHMNIHPLRYFSKILLTQTNFKTFISLTCIVLSPFCVNSVLRKVLVFQHSNMPKLQYAISRKNRRYNEKNGHSDLR